MLLEAGGFAWSTDWEPVVAALGPSVRTLAYDRPPFGLSERLVAGDWTEANPYAPDAAVTQLFALPDTQGIERAILVGNSAAGTLALRAAPAKPERVAGLPLVPPAVRAGADLDVDLTWRALGKIDAYYSVYLKLLDAGGNALAGWDGEPGGGQAPTLLWVPGETVEDRIRLSIPADTPAGEYCLVAGMYRAEDLARCLTLDAGGRPIPEILLGTVRVEP